MVSATKKIGRPKTGIGTPVQVRLSPEQLTALDEWIAGCPAPKPSRPEAIRMLMVATLAAGLVAKGKV